MRARVGVAALVMLCLPAAPASAAELFVDGSSDAAGLPSLTVTAPPDEGGTIKVSRCADGGSVCEPLTVTTTGPGRATADIGDPAPGTVFEATYEQGGAVVATKRSEAWQGRITNTQAPSLQGDPAVGSTISLTPATWSGGWAAPWLSRTEERIAACRNSNGTDCVVLSYGPPVALDPAWAGWYLFGTSARYSASVLGQPLYPAPPAATTFIPGPTQVLSAPLGPIRTPTATVQPPKPSSASIRAKAMRRNGRLVVGHVSCATRCTVKLTVSVPGRKTLRRTLTVKGAKSLTIPVRHGALKVRVVIDGKVLASAKSRAR